MWDKDTVIKSLNGNYSTFVHSSNRHDQRHEGASCTWVALMQYPQYDTGQAVQQRQGSMKEMKQHDTGQADADKAAWQKQGMTDEVAQ